MLRLRTLGGLSLTSDAGQLGGAAMQPRRLAVLAVLAVARGHGVTRDRLLSLLWPERDAASGRQALSQALYALRRDTGTEELVLGAGTEQLRLNPALITADVMEFEAAIASGAEEEAATHYQGPFLDGIYLSGDNNAFQQWIDEQRMRLDALAERVLESLAARAQERGDHATAADMWRRLTMLDPLRTIAAAGLMQALAASGNRAAALRHAEVYARRIREELDAEPSAVVSSLADRLREEVGDAGGGLIAGRYAIERELARGGMSVVLLARDVKHDRPVALKMLRAELNASIDRQRMLREIRITAQLQHPHILPLHDSGEHEGQLFYVMPYVDGETLRVRLQRDHLLPVSFAIRIARQIAQALEHAHRHGVVHRDVKPENVLLTGDGAETHAIVADFGIVHLLAGAVTERFTEPQFALGTPAYMSPEQIVGESQIDGRSDVFALGCVCYEMLTGRPPWVGVTPQAVLARRFAEAPPKPRTLRPDVPPALEDALLRALAIEPGDRFASAADFSRALDQSIASAEPRTVLPPVPAPATELVGRERERSAATALVVRSDVRLLTLTGAAGSGKTTLALQIAADAASAFDVEAFVDLSPLNDPALVPGAIAAALGVRDREDRSLLEATAVAIGDRPTLLLLDNVEHVVSAAPEIARLLGAAPRLTVLATSRVRLRLRVEHEFFVSPLDLPDLTRPVGVEELSASPAVRLFMRCARETNPELVLDDAGVRAVAEICVRLDGLPLAIELAAARMRLLTPSAMLARLAERRLDFLAAGARDLPARQRTLRGAIGWSYDLLAPRERAALRSLGVFAGAFSLNAMREVLNASELEALSFAQEFVDTSLVRRVGDDEDGPRLTLLETIREFALERLREAGEDATVRDRHLAHYLSVAERLAPMLTGVRQGEAVAHLERDRANVRAALEWAAARAEAGDPASMVRLARALWRAWLVSGAWTEGREWLRRAIRAADTSDASRGELLAAAGSLAQNQGDYADAYSSVDGARAAWRAAGDAAGEARALASLGWLQWRRCRFADARRLSEESLMLFRTLQDERGTAQALNNVGWVALFEGLYEESAATLAESLAIRRRLGDRREVAFSLAARAWASARAGDYATAEVQLSEALDTFRAIGERQLYAFATRVGAELALSRGDALNARDMLERVSIPIFREIGDRWGLYVALGVLGDSFLATINLEAARAAYMESDMIARSLEDDYGIATSDARFALLAAAEGDVASAEERATMATRKMADVGGTLAPWLASRLREMTAVTTS
ncbi:MAG TPA: protein kinase [Gemmatimonadaceae bacterium]|nr:protein kinase [Gemmatimonadaceae bacterium]